MTQRESFARELLKGKDSCFESGSRGSSCYQVNSEDCDCKTTMNVLGQFSEINLESV